MRIINKWPEAKNDEVIEEFNKNIDKLIRLHVLIKHDEFIQLNQNFAENIQNTLSGSHQLTVIKEKSSSSQNGSTLQSQTQLAKNRLERIIFFLLEVSENNLVNDFVKSLLIETNLISK